MEKKILIDELIVKNLKELSLEIKKYIEANKIIKGRFKAQCDDFAILLNMKMDN